MAIFTSDVEVKPDNGCSLYREEYAEQARKLCEQFGAIDADLADFFDVTQRTINNWKIRHKEFFEALKLGKEPTDQRVKNSLYQQTQGYYVTEQQAIKIKDGKDKEKVEVVQVEKYIAPNVNAMIYWTKNRDPDNWRDKQDHNHSGDIVVNITKNFDE